MNQCRSIAVAFCLALTLGACSTFTAAQTNSTSSSDTTSSSKAKPAKAKSKNAGSHTIQPYTAAPVQAYQSKPIQEYHSTPIQPNGSSGQDSRPAPNRNPAHHGSLIGTFGLAVPGVAYTVDNYAANTRTLVTSTGALTKSAVRINPNHTYEWNSAWDGKMIHGTWTEKNGGIELHHGQEGKDWLLRTLDRPSGKATVTLWDQNSIWYNGTPLN